jgi:hypothetical protein
MRCPECWRFNPCADHPGAAEEHERLLEADRLVEASWDG